MYYTQHVAYEYKLYDRPNLHTLFVIIFLIDGAKFFIRSFSYLTKCIYNSQTRCAFNCVVITDEQMICIRKRVSTGLLAFIRSKTEVENSLFTNC